MPPPTHRKKPFSAKQKKKQLKEKRDRKREDGDEDWGGSRNRRHRAKAAVNSADASCEDESDQENETNVQKINQQPLKAVKGYDPNRYRLHFQQETHEEINQRKEKAREPHPMLSEESLELDIDQIYLPGSVLDMPKRPPWSYKMSRQQLQAREEAYFREYLDSILEKYNSSQLSYMELNLETWRQLWRVLEMSDIILLITDIRHPALHFSPALYDFVTKDIKKPLILVLNKVDLAPPSLVIAWQHYFKEKFPDLHIVLFTSFPKNHDEMQSDFEKVLHKKRRKGTYRAVGPRSLLCACEAIVQNQVDLSSWRDKIAEDEELFSGSHDYDDFNAGLENVMDVKVEQGDGAYEEHVRFRDGVLTIGCCGYPNVGKSSLMNGLVGKKVVSVSRTPGHTKHFQTIFLTKSVKLCDSPGLVFPSLVSKPLQILAGIYPIAQVREPYSAVGFLAQRLPLPKMLHLTHPDDTCTGEEAEWSAYDICEAWAVKRGFVTARASRPDVYRAANSLLRLAVQGRIIMCMRPPGFTAQKGKWEDHEDTAEITQLQLNHQKHHHSPTHDLTTSPSEEEEEGERQEEEVEEEEEEEGQIVGIAHNNPYALLGED